MASKQDKTTMTKLTVISTDTDVYPDQTNVTVTIELDNSNIYRIQTDAKGNHNTQQHCCSWLNDSEDFERCENVEFDNVVVIAEQIAKIILFSRV